MPIVRSVLIEIKNPRGAAIEGAIKRLAREKSFAALYQLAAAKKNPQSTEQGDIAEVTVKQI